MGDCGAFFGRRGVVGFSGPVLGVSSGVVGFNVALFLRAVRDICRPALPAPSVVREIVSPANPKWVKALLSGVLGEFFRGRAAEWGVLGEFFAELRALMVGVWCVRSGCGRRSSAGGNVACHSPQGIPSCELESLKFCRLQSVVDVGSEGIACDL